MLAHRCSYSELQLPSLVKRLNMLVARYGSDPSGLAPLRISTAWPPVEVQWLATHVEFLGLVFTWRLVASSPMGAPWLGPQMVRFGLDRICGPPVAWTPCSAF